MKKILITGSEGFIGKALIHHLIKVRNSYELFTLDRTGSGRNHVLADITIDDLTSRIREIDPDVIVHLAGNVSVPFSLKYPLEDFNVNAKGTLAVLLAAEPTSCKNFVYITSGGAIYDPLAPMPLKEESPIKPISPYGLSKYVAEGYIRVLCEARKTGWSSLALSNSYGPIDDQKQGVIYRFWQDIVNGNNPTIYGDSVARDFIYIDDVVKALVSVIENPVNMRVNISSNTSTKLKDLLAEIQHIMGSNLEPKIELLRDGEVEVSQLDNRRALQFLKWAPAVDLRSGLRKCLGVS